MFYPSTEPILIHETDFWQLTTFGWVQLPAGSVHLDILEALKLSTSGAKASSPSPQPAFCPAFLSEWQQLSSSQARNSGGSLAHLSPLTSMLHVSPSATASCLCCLFCGEPRLLPPNRYPACGLTVIHSLHSILKLSVDAVNTEPQ